MSSTSTTPTPTRPGAERADTLVEWYGELIRREEDMLDQLRTLLGRTSSPLHEIVESNELRPLEQLVSVHRDRLAWWRDRLEVLGDHWPALAADGDRTPSSSSEP
ncbi:MAG: hypothetical protein J2P40_10650 [Candidatus Dormibacteraeota bacterium]|nr:hypothetical protein [Candidatus Dormibacteraeota bacterium]MBO0761721.1 hypothetical protein [Candidatus Dormibacteraeota bacterium]